jgi:acetyltransferase-like isoleucine patch superfamily enzyme
MGKQSVSQASRPTPGKTQPAVTGEGSAFARYQSVIVGKRGLWSLLYYECCVWFSWIPGALGLALRKFFWPRLFGSCGEGVQFGTNITLMHPHRIHLGPRTVVGNGCILDARNSESDRAIVIGAEGILSHGVMISAKSSCIVIGRNVGLGPYTVLQAAQDSIHLGDDVIIAAQCYVGAGGDYYRERLDVPIAKQGARSTGDTRLQDGVWLGTGVRVLGGVTIGEHSIVGAGAVVTTSLPSRAVCVGIPARVVRWRQARPEGVATTGYPAEARG